ncbi:MFS transporter [Paenibacillus kobensis]|uniref:MFS transporter n=1 Tax=Paenibacillus kobensis TaxID=59841 RepID=UPI000FD986AC|nr:MFS transporter [Paenibacillus kobensis]
MNGRFHNSPYAYALGMLAMMIPIQAFSSFYSYYYVEKLGLSVGLATIARTVFLVWDAANNPLLGYWSDRTRTKYGRRKPWIVAAIPLFMLTLAMVFYVPSGLQGYSLFVWLLIALVLFEAVTTVLWVNYGALFPELFRGDRQRAKASAVQQGFQIVAILIGSSLTPILFDAIGFSSMSIVYAVVFAFLMILFIRNISESKEALQAEPLKLVQAFRETLSNRRFWIFNLSNSFAQTVNGLLGSMIPFYAKYVLRIPESQVSLLLAAVFVSVIPCVGIWYWIVKRMDSVHAWRLSLIVYAIAVIPLWFGTSLATGIAAGIAAGFGLAGFLVTPNVVSGTIIDLDAAITGQRREGIYTAVGGFITRSSGLLSAIAFWIVGIMFGYVSGDEPGSNPALAFRYLISAIPMGLLMISFLLSLGMRRFDKP